MKAQDCLAHVLKDTGPERCSRRSRAGQWYILRQCGHSGHKQIEEASGVFAGENRLQGLPEQEDFSSYPLAGMKGSADPRRPPCCPSKRRQAGTFLTLASFSLEPP